MDWRSRHGNEEQSAEVLRGQSGAHQGAAQSFFANLFRHLDPGVVVLSPARELRVTLDGQREMTSADPHARVQAPNDFGLVELVGPLALQRFLDFFL